MKVMAIVKASADSEAGKLPTQQLLENTTQFNDQLVKAGILLAAVLPKPELCRRPARILRHQSQRHGGTVHGDQRGRSPASGSGRSSRWTRRRRALRACPNSMLVDSYIEIRPLFEEVESGAAPDARSRRSKTANGRSASIVQLDPAPASSAVLPVAAGRLPANWPTVAAAPASVAQRAWFVPHLGTEHELNEYIKAILCFWVLPARRPSRATRTATMPSILPIAIPALAPCPHSGS